MRFIDGPPRLLWQSVDGRVEEVPPTRRNQTGEMIGGGFAEYQRTVAMRQGRVYISKAQKSNKSETAGPRLTPITPGYYRYQADRLRRVAAPPRCLSPKSLDQLAKAFFN